MGNRIICSAILVVFVFALIVSYVFTNYRSSSHLTIESDLPQLLLPMEKRLDFVVSHSKYKLKLLSAKHNQETKVGKKSDAVSIKHKMETETKYKLEPVTAKLNPESRSDQRGSGKSVMAAGSDVVTEGEEREVRWRHLHSDCPDVLTLMLTGHWIPRVMTSAEKNGINKFYADVRGKQNLPLNLQRSDRKCGNVPFPEPNYKWRAMCDPDGPAPCCYRYICTNATREQCTCTVCTDMRTLIHAEYATWRADDARCQPMVMSVTDICNLLDGYTLAFVGDSHMKHLYTAFLMVINGDLQFGALQPGASEEVKQRCHSMYLFPKECNCLQFLDFTATSCEGTVNTTFIDYPHPIGNMTPSMMIEEVTELQKQKKIFTVIGFASHYGLNASRVEKQSLLPLLEKLSTTQSVRNSKVLWTEVHAPTVLKSPVYAKHAYICVHNFNKEIRRVLRQYDVPSFDTYNLTSHPLMTFDGSHFGLGVNRMKAVILLDYLLELRAKGLW